MIEYHTIVIDPPVARAGRREVQTRSRPALPPPTYVCADCIPRRLSISLSEAAMIHCTTCFWFYMTRQGGKQTLLLSGCNNSQRPDPCQCPGYQTLEDWMMKTWNEPESLKHLCSTCVWCNLPPEHRPPECNPLRVSIQTCSKYESRRHPPLCSTCVWFHRWPDRMPTCCNPVRESIQHDSPCLKYERRQHDPPAPFPERYESSLPPETHTCKTCKYVSQPCCSWCKVLDPRRDCPDCWAPRPTGKKP